MIPRIGIGQLCGLLFLFVLITTILSKSMAGAPLEPADVANTLGRVAEGANKYRTSIVFDLVSHISIVALAGVLYLAARDLGVDQPEEIEDRDPGVVAECTDAARGHQRRAPVDH